MIRLTRHGDVTRAELASRRSRLAGYSVSAYLVRGVVVDTGFHGARRDVSAWLDAVRPRGVVVTHWHEDHAGNVELVARRAIPIAASDETLRRAREVEPIAFYRRFTWGAMPPLASPVAPFVPGDLEIVAAPGHSPDHTVVWDPEHGTLFGGDLFLGVKVRVAHDDEDLPRLAGTLRALAARGPERLFDAHRGLVENPVPLLRAKADWLDEAVAAIARRVADGWTDAMIARAVLGREGWVDWISGREYSKRSLVRSVRRHAPAR